MSHYKVNLVARLLSLLEKYVNLACASLPSRFIARSYRNEQSQQLFHLGRIDCFFFFLFFWQETLSHLENRTLLEKDTKNATKRQREGEGQE